MTIASAVIVQITTVSMNGSSSATKPSVAGSLVFTAECAIEAEPMPASLEKAARWKPTISTPMTPPATLSGLKAPVKMAPKAAGHLVDVADDDDEAGRDVDGGHERHDLLGHPGDALDAADDHRADERPRRRGRRPS